MEKVTSLSTQYERESAKRLAVERSLERQEEQWELDRQMAQQRYEQELDRKRVEWELEKDSLLAVVQKDCNSAFEQHQSTRRDYYASNSSPFSTRTATSNLTTFFETPHSNASSSSRRRSRGTARKVSDASEAMMSSSAKEKAPVKLTIDTSAMPKSNVKSPPLTAPTVISPAFSEFDNILRETEDLVQSILV